MVVGAGVGVTVNTWAQIISTVFIGVAAYYLKRIASTWVERGDRQERHERLLAGTEGNDGIIDVVDLHDDELSTAERHRKLLERRLSLAEQRISRIAEEAGARNGLAEQSKRLREQTVRVRRHNDDVDMPKYDPTDDPDDDA